MIYVNPACCFHFLNRGCYSHSIRQYKKKGWSSWTTSVNFCLLQAINKSHNQEKNVFLQLFFWLDFCIEMLIFLGIQTSYFRFIWVLCTWTCPADQGSENGFARTEVWWLCTLMSPNNGETAVHGCPCRGDMVVNMRNILAIPRS